MSKPARIGGRESRAHCSAVSSHSNVRRPSGSYADVAFISQIEGDRQIGSRRNWWPVHSRRAGHLRRRHAYDTPPFTM